MSGSRSGSLMNWWCARWCSRKWNVVVRMGKAREPVGGELVELAVGEQHVVRALVHDTAELVLGGTDGDDRQHGHGNAQPPRDLARHGEVIEVDGAADRDGEDDVDAGEIDPVGGVVADLEDLDLFRRLVQALASRAVLPAPRRRLGCHCCCYRHFCPFPRTAPRRLTFSITPNSQTILTERESPIQRNRRVRRSMPHPQSSRPSPAEPRGKAS